MPPSLVMERAVLYYCAMTIAVIDEVFASLQGEGPWVGQRHIFVRFVGCDLRCAYCDSPEALKAVAGREMRSCRAQISPGSFEREQVANPVSPLQLSVLCSRLTIPGPARPIVSLTGGEPLLHHEFLRVWLPEARRTYRIYLETSGIHFEAMEALNDLVDFVSMDIKLPSATGQKALWEEHMKFLAAAAGHGLFVKAVVTMDTAPGDIMKAAQLTADHDRTVPFIIQPVSGRARPEKEMLVQFQAIALEVLEDVRVIPQVHRILNLP